MLDQTLSRPAFSPWPLIRGAIRFTLFFIIVLLFILHHEAIKLIIRNEERRLRYFVKSVSWHTKLGLKLLSIQIDDQTFSSDRGASLYVSNHLSYLDVLVLFSRFPALFITSREIGEVILLGHLTKLAGCFHVERRKSHRTPEMIALELSSMKEKLHQGMNLFLFPEGTSSNGTTVLPFKAHFFQTALDLKLPIIPLCLKYDWEGSHPDEICWYGDMTFADHLFKVCCRSRIHVTVKELPFEYGQMTERHEVAQTIQKKIKDIYEKH